MPLSDAELGSAMRLRLDRSGVVGRKIGQFLAMRLDLIPQAVSAELDKLFDSAEPMPFSLVRETIEQQLAAPLSDLFRSFTAEPIAVASIGQVHIAVAADGQKLAIKVQRPGIAVLLAAELRILHRLAQVSDALRLTGTLSAVDLLDEFAEFTWTELEFEKEAVTTERFRRQLGPRVRVPEVRFDLTAPRLLAMEFIEGITLLEVCRLHEAGRDDEIDRRLPGVDIGAVMERVAHESYRQHFDVGFFHGDPNPGNILVCPDGTFAFIDFGISGELNTDDRASLLGFAEMLVRGRCLESARHYLRLCTPTPATRIADLEAELVAALFAWRRILLAPDAPLEERHISVWQGRFAALLQKHRVRSRRNLLLVWRAWVLLDATTLRLPIEFDLISSQARFFGKRRLQGIFGWLQHGPDLTGMRRAARFAIVAPARAPPPTWHQTSARGRRRQLRFSGLGIACAVVLVGVAVVALLAIVQLPQGGAKPKLTLSTACVTPGAPAQRPLLRPDRGRS